MKEGEREKEGVKREKEMIRRREKEKVSDVGQSSNSTSGRECLRRRNDGPKKTKLN